MGTNNFLFQKKMDKFYIYEQDRYCVDVIDSYSYDSDYSLIKDIRMLIGTDDALPEKQSEILFNHYKNASINQRKAIDACFVALCGYGMDTIIERCCC